jgi:hypothetical protein
MWVFYDAKRPPRGHRLRLAIAYVLVHLSAVAAEPGQLCFSSRADEQSFTGVWSPGPPEGDSWDNCEHPAVIIKHHLCDVRHPQFQKLGRTLDDRFDATSCWLPPMNYQAFVGLIGPNRTLWYVGDSIMRQMFEAQVCAFERFRPAERPWGLSHVELMKDQVHHSVSMLLEKEEKRHHKHPTQPADTGHFVSRCVTLVDGTRICHLWTTHAEELMDILQVIGRNPREYVVTNFGLHKNSLPRNSETLKEQLRRWSAMCADGDCARLVWRETSPQHFHTPGGLFDEALKNKNQWCAPHMAEHAALADKYNIENRPVLLRFQSARFHVLPVWAVAAEKWNFHAADCTHWCMPGMPDLWLRMLYSMMKAHSEGAVEQPRST